MIIVDLNQIVISNLMGSLSEHSEDVNEELLRHMVLNSIRQIRNQFVKEYGEMVIACDDRNYWRKKVFPYYKANRKKMRSKVNVNWNDFYESFGKIREELKEIFPYPTIKIDSAEADDIIAVLCHEHGRELGGDPILIISADKDFLQLQKYSNVKQYDPIRKRWLSTSDPKSFLIEHILKGDTGDGIPNFLSADDTFVAGGRQKQLRSKVIHEVLSSDWPEDWSGITSETLRNYNRNRMLIDLSCVPNEIQEEVKRVYEEQQGKSRGKLFNYFIKNKLKNLMENLSEF